MMIGAHVSVAGGLDKAIQRGEAMGAEAIQTFASSPRSIKYKPYEQTEIEKYLAAKAVSGVKLHVFHGVYLINLAHENPEYVAVCVDSLSYYQKLAKEIGGYGTVFHIGSYKGDTFETKKKQVVEAIGQVVAEMPEGVWLLLENAAGQGGVIGKTMEQLGAVMAGVEALGVGTERLGVCIDTQHAWASGYEIDTQAGFERLKQGIEAELGLDKVKLIHVNDSKVECGSNKDRHENLGMGNMGVEAVKRFLSEPAFAKLPYILEVPGEKKSGPRKVDVMGLKRIAGEQ